MSVTVQCFSCHRKIKVIFKPNRKYAFCKKCVEKFFFRPSGTRVEGMDATREIVRIRDGHRCTKCKRRWTYGTRRFDIHHLKGLCGRRSRAYDPLNTIKNLVTLCHRCHLGLKEVRKKISTKGSERPQKDKDYARKNKERINYLQRERSKRCA